MLRIIQRFGKHYSCHLQGDCVEVGRIWKPYIGQAVGGELDLMVLIGGAEERADIQWEKSMWMRKRLPEPPNLDTFTLKMATAMFAEKLDNSQHSTRPITESQSYTSNSGREKLKTRIT
jgi:hypothetical protein